MSDERQRLVNWREPEGWERWDPAERMWTCESDSAQALQEARALVTKAEGEDRDLTPKEQEDYDKLRMTARRLELRAQEISQEHGVQRTTPGTNGTSVRGTTTPGDRYGAVQDDGQEVRALREDESAVDYLRQRDAIRHRELVDGVSLGGYLRSILLGPQTDDERRALGGTSDSAGGYTVPDILSAQLIDLLRPASHVLASGARMVALDSDRHSFARVASDPDPVWRDEHDPVTEDEPTFDIIHFTPKSVAFLVRASRELLQDTVNLETELPNLFTRVMASELDRVALLGDPTEGEPQGIRGASGVSEHSMGTDGGAIEDYAPFLAMRRLVKDANAPEGVPDTVIYAPRTGETVEGLTATDGQPLRRPPAMENWRFRETSKIPTDESQGTADDASTAFVGGFPFLWIGQRLDVRVETLRERFADNLQVGFLVHARWDIQLQHPAMLGRIIGITPAE